MHEGDKIYNNSKEKDLNIQSNIIPDNKGQAIVCNCTKSKCMKKYCECYKMGFDCGNLCRCIDCQKCIKTCPTNTSVINETEKQKGNNHIVDNNFSYTCIYLDTFLHGQGGLINGERLCL